MKLDIGDVLSRSWRITWRYKALWFLGFLVALPGGCGSGMNIGSRFQSSSSGSSGQGSPPDLQQGLDRLHQVLPAGLGQYLSQIGSELSTLRQSDLLSARPMLLPGILLMLVSGLLLIWLSAGLVGYVARAGLVRSIDRIDAGAEAPSLREAWRLGWSTRTLRLLLADFLMGILSLILILPIATLAILPLILSIAVQAESDDMHVAPILVAVGLCLAGVFLIGVLVALLRVLGQLWTREIVVSDAPIGSAVSQAVATMRRHTGNLFMFWLALLVIGAGVGVALLPLSVLMGLLFAGLGLGLGALLKAVLGSLLGAFSGLISLVLGVALSAVIFGLPLAAFQGLYAVFQTGAWTLAWRRLAGSPPPATIEPEATPFVTDGIAATP